MAAVVLVAVVAIDHQSLVPPAPNLHVADAADATVQRGASRLDLEPGMELRAGDVIRTADRDGRATLSLAGGETRLAPATAVGIVAAGTDITLDQHAGRVWHRVGAAVGTYAVQTDDVTWVATGTAFDLDRRPAAAGGEEVRAIAIDHDVRIDGRSPTRVLPEGFTTIVPLDDPAADPVDAVRSPMTTAWTRGCWRTLAAMSRSASMSARSVASSSSGHPTRRHRPRLRPPQARSRRHAPNRR
jgi:hypothetical protein